MAKNKKIYGIENNSSEEQKKGYTKEQNKEALLAQIDEIENAYLNGDISFKDKSAQIYAIRFRLQDKFDMEHSDTERRILVVPAKHLFICPYTNRECSNMPEKEVCMKHYGLVEKKELERLQKEVDKLQKRL